MGGGERRAEPARARREPDRRRAGRGRRARRVEAAASGAISAAVSRIRGLVDYDAALAEPLGLLESAAAQLDEAVHALRHYADRVDLDPRRLAEAERRVEALHAAARRFRTQPEALAELAGRVEARLAELAVAADLDELVRQEAAARALRRARRPADRAARVAAAKLGRKSPRR